MGKKSEHYVFWILGFILLACSCHVSVAVTGTRTYIIHMAKSRMPAIFEDHSHWYDSSLKSVSGSAEILYTYDNAIHGFSARMTPEEAEALANRPGIVSVMPELKYELHTTRTPSFLGLDQNSAMFPESESASDVIVGVLDTGVWPESPSYDDTGLGPVPSFWKGECEVGTNFTKSNCNRKLVGARFFSKGYEATLGPVDQSKESKSPRDDDGHGTHTSSTAAGSVVTGASLFGYAAGTARGMAPRARVAVYKVCWIGGCFSSDILAAIEKAIDDNVNVLSMSLGGGVSDYFRDSVASGAFAAMEKGILISCSAGNAGPSSYSLSNVAPWITTVGAGTLDRDFPAYVSLGNGKNYSGVSLYKGGPLPGKMLPLIYAGNATNATNGNLCMTDTLIPEKVAGKVVLCDRGVNPRVQKGSVVKAAGGAGMVLTNTVANGEELVADAHLLPATAVGQTTGETIKSYLFSDSNPTATIFFEGTKVGIQPSPVVAAFSSRGPNPISSHILKPDIIAPGVNILASWSGGTKVGIQPSPVVAAFSSRGPNPISSHILKPDIIAPGVNILASWSGAVGPTGLAEDNRRVGFNIISGTSMSCPHVSGLAALLKGAHPDWSPAAIRSALMTTAKVVDKNGKLIEDVSTGKPSTPFDHGAGHVDPVSALNPGLIYDLDVDDYLNFLCALNYTTDVISGLAKKNFTCDSSKSHSINDFNYPSFAVSLPATTDRSLGSGDGTSSNTVKYTRTVTNVGSPGTYKVSISTSDAFKVSVDPEELAFSQTNEKKSYTATFTSVSQEPVDANEFGRIEWSDGKHVVGSPIAVSWT